MKTPPHKPITTPKHNAPLGFLRLGAMDQSMVKSLEQGVAMVLTLLTLLLIYTIVLGDGGYFATLRMEKSLAEVRAINHAWVARNAKIAVEVADLTHGQEVIIEQARHNYLLVRADETYYRLLEKPANTTP